LKEHDPKALAQVDDAVTLADPNCHPARMVAEALEARKEREQEDAGRADFFRNNPQYI
jgi:hypothetical protein